MTLERGIAALVLIGLGWLIYRLVSRAGLRRMARGGLQLDDYRAGRPAILYFTTPDCAPCRNVQAPTLDWLRAQYSEELQVIEIDAVNRPDLADAWGVLSVPTTFLIDSMGRPRGVNHGLASQEKLLSQLSAIGEGLPQPESGPSPVGSV